MRVLLRRYRSGLFFREIDDWTASPTKAFDFAQKERAVQRARELGEREVDVVVVQDDGSVLFGRRLSELELDQAEGAVTEDVGQEKPAAQLNILVAEDLDSDAQLLRMAFKRAGVTVPINFVSNGVDAIDYLKGNDDPSDQAPHPMPDMFLLDLKMPRMDGFEVLEWVRGQSGLKRLIVIVLTASALKVDVNRAYDLGANSYLVKPNDFDALEGIARNLRQYWLDHNTYPDCCASLV